MNMEYQGLEASPRWVADIRSSSFTCSNITPAPDYGASTGFIFLSPRKVLAPNMSASTCLLASWTLGKLKCLTLALPTTLAPAGLAFQDSTSLNFLLISYYLFSETHSLAQDRLLPFHSVTVILSVLLVLLLTSMSFPSSRDSPLSCLTP